MASVAVALLAGCAAKGPPPAPPAPPVVVIPPRPRPPLGAQTGLVPPPADALGNRNTVNVGITSAQTTWNLRSAYNVAALNCMKLEHTDILANYKDFLRSNAKPLSAANAQIDREYRASSGARAIKVREAYMTRVYNFYALPPTLPAFCDAALAMSRSLKAASPPAPAATVRARSAKGRAKAPPPPPGMSAKQLDAFAAAQLPMLDRVFLDFYNSYDQYRADLANWQQKYAPTEVPALAVMPGTGPSTSVTIPTN